MADKEAEAAEKAYATALETRPAKAEPSQAAAPLAKPPVAETKPVAAKAELAKASVAKSTPEPAAKTPAATKSAAPEAPAPKAPASKAPASKPAVTPKAAVKPTKALAKAKPKRAAKPKAKAALPKIVPPKTTSPKTPLSKIEMKPAVKNITSLKPATKLKEIIMAKTDFTKSVTEAVADLQTRAKGAYEKTTEVAGEVTEFTKGNVEAMVESGKIFTEGFKALSKTYAEEAKSALETATADLKEMAAIKSPTELFQLQGKLMRRNFEAMMAFSSKNSDAVVKLANEGIAPISSRMSLAAEKVSKAA
ncbi:MAG: phasin family protein [Proteobacteria bacterium]|nr:MAG: phasin family protein [Pseudomonadota bacterium]